MTVMKMNKRLREGYEEVRRFYGEDTVKELLKEYEYYKEDWRRIAGAKNYSKFEPVALPLLQWSYLHTVHFSEVLERLDSVRILKWTYRKLSILPEPNKLYDALLLAGNAGGDRIIKNGDWLTVIWYD